MRKRNFRKIKKILLSILAFAILLPNLGCQVASELTDPDKYTKTNNSEPWEKKGKAKVEKKDTNPNEPKKEDF